MESVQAMASVQVKAGIDASLKGSVGRLFFDAVAEDEDEIPEMESVWDSSVAEQNTRKW